MSELYMPKDKKFSLLVLTVSMYIFFTPIFVASTPVGFLGATELLSILGVLSLISLQRIHLSMASLAYLIFLLAFILSNLIVAATKSVGSSQLLLLRLLTSFLPFLLLDQSNFFNSNTLKLFQKLFIFSLTSSVIAGLIMFNLGIELRDGQQRLWYEGGNMARAGGLTGNSGGFGFVSAIFICYLWIHRALSDNRFSVIAFSFLVFIGLTAIALSSSRAAFLFIVVMSLVLLFFRLIILDINIFKSLFHLVVLLVFISWIPFFTSFLDFDTFSFISHSLVRLDILNLSGQDVFLSTSRFSNWPIVISAIEDNLFFGLGYKQFYSFYDIYSDNSFLGVTVDGGIFSLIPYCLFWIGCLGESMYKTIYVDFKYRYLVAFLMGSISFAFTVDFYSMWYPSALFFMGYGLIRLSLHSKVSVQN